jgi:photosystem II stability/assembly factor-like uncharacterized protein
MASDDEGVTWRQVSPGHVLGLAVNPVQPDVVLAAGPSILLSHDGGTTWETARAIPEGAGPVAWAPSEPGTAYVVGFDQRLYRSTDTGTTWATVG